MPSGASARPATAPGPILYVNADRPNATRYDILAALNEQREKLTEKDRVSIVNLEGNVIGLAKGM